MLPQKEIVSLSKFYFLAKNNFDSDKEWKDAIRISFNVPWKYHKPFTLIRLFGQYGTLKVLIRFVPRQKNSYNPK